MKISGSYTLDAPRDRAWPMIFDPAQLMSLIPGCDQIEADGPDSYRGAISLRLPAVSGNYRTAIKIVERREPEFCRLSGEAAGPGGSVTGQAAFTLREVDGRTRVEYEGDAAIAGPLAGVNPRFVEGAAQQLIRQGLARLDARAVAALASEEAGAPAPVKRVSPWRRFFVWLGGHRARFRL